MQGRLTLTASIPGDTAPDTRITPSGTQNGVTVLQLNLAGTATDDKGVQSVRVSIRENDSSRYLQANGSLGADFYARDGVLGTPGGTSTTWSLPTITLPTEGDYSVTAIAYDTAGQQDTSTSGATSRYPIYPGDLAPTVLPDLMQPTTGAVFTDGKIVISGRVVDDRQIAQAQVAIVDAQGRYMGSSGTFTSTNASWRTAFLNSPGSLGSNYSYTTPVIPSGVYRVLVRGIDHHGFTTNPPAEATNITVNTPASNPPVANFTYTCAQNVCEFDARTSTDENTPTLTYSWNFGQGSGSGPLPDEDLHVGRNLHGDADGAGRVQPDRHLQPDDHHRGADDQRGADPGDQPAELRRTPVQLLRRGHGGSERGRHVQLPLDLG